MYTEEARSMGIMKKIYEEEEEEEEEAGLGT